MRQRFQQSLLLLFSLLLIPLGAWADREVLQPQFGKQTIEVGTDEIITFYDPWGTENIVDNNSYNAQSLTVFRPAEAGMSVQLTFEKIDLNQYNSSYYLYLSIYDGVADADDAFAWPTTTSGITGSSSLNDMSGTLVAEKVNNDNKPSMPAVYTSGTADGALSVGFMHRNSNTCEGWVAKVKCVKLENMTVTGAGSDYNGVKAQPLTKQNVALANAYVTTTGVMNPDHVTAIGFTMTQNEDVVDPLAMKLFYGDRQLEATVSAIDAATGTYQLTLDQALADGTNTFTLRADVLSTALVGAKVQVDITKVATTLQNEGITPFAAGTSVVVENPAIVLMTATPLTVTVGETALNFYDEGGLDGGIFSKTNGQVTFLSGVSGQKVMVDFTKNQIWHGSYYNQELRIYSGQEAVADKLIKTLQQGETGLVRSTADDGSLTVVLFSDASNSVEADGFEALVSLFTPQPMDFNGLETAAASTETVAAGDEAQDMLTVNVKAQNTEPAMQVTKMTFSAGESYALVPSASLYFGSSKVGETVLDGSAFEITLTSPQPLTEGDNRFTLKYAISDEALNDQTVTAQLVSVTALVNNARKTETAPADATTATRTVKNIVLNHADQGTVTKTVNGSMAFETKAKSEYSDNYEAGTDERINVFKPKHSGYVCQMDFSEFAIYSSSWSPSSSAKFKIYSGQGTTGELLWEPASTDDYTTGPGRIVRSTAEDGALTVVFNPNQSYSTAAGWKATVSEYLQKDMDITAVEATQASTADVSIGATAQELLNVSVKTDGGLNPQSVSSMRLSLKGTEANMTTVSVWQDDTKLGEAAAAAEVEVVFSEAVTLTEGDNRFTVKADISGTAEDGQTIDAALLSLSVGDNIVAATAGDPEGCRTLKNMVLMTAGDHGLFQLALGQQTMVYDDGGPEGDGADGVEATVTLAPTGEADCIKLTDQGISFAYTAHLYIYKGSEADDANLIVDLSGSSAKFEPIVSDATVDGGKLTIKYVGKGSYTKPNFAVKAEGYKKQSLAVTAITTEDISVNEVLKGQTDVKMLKIAVETKGELDSLNITAFNVGVLNAEPVDTFRIYTTGTAASFSANQAFTDNFVICKEGTYYFWLVYDLKATAEVGQTTTAVITSLVVNGSAVDIMVPNSATIIVASGKSGTYTVGAGADYATLQGAVDDLGTLGMEGPVVLKVKAGQYNEKVRIPYIKGMGSANTLIIESESGQRDVKIYHDNYTTVGYSDDQHKKDYGVVTLYEASYVTLRNLEVTTSDVSYKAVVMVKDQSRHVTIDNCYLHAPVTTSGDVCLVGHTIIDEENKNNDYLTVSNCLLEGGKMGVSMGGTSYVALPKEVGGVIEGNTFKNNGTKAIYVMDELGAKIRNNTVIIEADAETKNSVGWLDMQLRDEYSEPTEITGNIFNIAAKTYSVAMNLRQLEGTADVPVIVANNVVNMVSLNASYSPFKLNNTKVKYVNIAHNTLRMTGASGGAAFWASSKFDDAYGIGINVVNNIIQNETGGYAVNLYNDVNLTKINFQNNLISTTGETFFRASSGTEGDFELFVEKTAATGCYNRQALFVSDDVLEPVSTLGDTLLQAMPLSYVTTDINGTVRPDSAISIGAYEYDPDLTRVPVMADGYPKAAANDWHTATVSVKTDMNGRAYVAVLRADADNTAMTADSLMAIGKPLTLIKEAEATLKVDTLQELTSYVAYVVAVSTRGNATALLLTDTIATPMEPIDLLIACTAPQTTVSEGSEAALKVMVASGLAPFNVKWTDSRHELVADTTVTELGEEIMVNILPQQSGDYYVTITDAQLFEAKDTCRIIVTGQAIMADFENLFLEPNSFWRGPDTKGAIEEGLYGDSQYQGSFVSGSYRFANNYSIDWGSWSGFSYANRTDTVFQSYTTDQWNAVTGCGADSSSTYAVFFEDEFAPMTVTVLNREDGDSIRGFYVTNAAVTVNSILHGDGQTSEKDANGNPVGGDEGFRKSDFFKLTVFADNGKKVEFFLADYRSEDSLEHYYVKDWQWVDLSSLGKVKELTFSLEASRKNAWGYTTPLYFCMDNFNGTAPEEPVVYEGPATMEELELADNSFWNGSDGSGSFISGAYRFENGYELNDYGEYAYGFFYSNKTDTTFADYTTDMYNSCVGHGAEGSKTYAVFNVPYAVDKGIEVLSSADGDSITGFYVANAAYTMKSMKNGDSYAKKFDLGDWLKLTVKGLAADGTETGTVDFYLADLRKLDSAYIHSDWRWVDLTSLGKVKRLAFEMSSSDTSYGYMNTPAYFCLDNLGGTKPEQEEPVEYIALGIANLISHQTAGQQAVYDLGGRKLIQVRRGLNIVRQADGTLRKVMVK
ncbi:MAG: DUF4465 domain-containing protein [Prevotella sp.]|nr:DUF4465 domain-containing protein [Prevotella sp.]